MTARKFADQVVWITGASSGIGEALARQFAAAGARLILSARRREELERVAELCRESPSVTVLPLDLAALETLPDRVNEALRAYGHVDIMVHNGGVSQRSRAIETTIAVDEQLMRVNYFGAVALTKALLPAMVSQRRGVFVVVSSLVGVFGTPLRSSYSASKHALHGFFDSLRAEHHDDGIRVTIACPGFVRTQVSMNAMRGDGGRQGTMDEATAKGISPDECAAGVLRAVAAGREEVYVGGRERFAVYLKRFVPRMFSRLARSARVV